MLISVIVRALVLLTTGMIAMQSVAAPAPLSPGSSRSSVLPVPRDGRTGFTLLDPASTGLRFTNSIDEIQSAANRVLLNGSGVAVGDFDRDGRPDLFFCSLNGQNTLYRNLGDMRFADVTSTAGLRRDQRFYRGAVFADVNGDGAPDLLVAILGAGVECWLNNGQGHFSDATAAARTASDFGPMTLALADVDGNGALDLYVANNRVNDVRDRGQVDLRLVNGTMVVPPEFRDRLIVVNGQVLELGEPDHLFLNDGRGRFAPVSWTGGRFRNEDGQPLTSSPLDWGLTATFRDLNNDGFPDLYVCNDFWTPDRIWINDGKGRFQAVARRAMRNMCASSMGVDFADIDRDGWPDMFVVDMLSRDPRLRRRQGLAQTSVPAPVGVVDDRPQFMRNTLYRNCGDGTFAELANYAGVAASDWSWSPIFIDVDLDGFEDLLISAGHAKDVQDLDAQAQIRARQHSWKGFATEAERQQAFTRELAEHMRLYPRLDLPIVAFRNGGDLRFTEMTGAWGTGQLGVHHGMATADLDGDGDLDLVVNNLGSVAGLYRNDSAAPRIAVRLVGAGPNTQGIGAKVTLLGGTVPRQTEEVVSGGRYVSGSDSLIVLAPGSATNGLAIDVVWRSGRRSHVDGVRINQLYEVAEPSGDPASPTSAAPGSHAPLLADASARLNHHHHEEAFDDFARQSLLPAKLSQNGPGLAWFDLDGDGQEELFIGSGRGGMLGAFRVRTNAAFEPIPLATTTGVPDDMAGLAGWVSGSGRRYLLGGLTAYENPAAPAVLAWELVGGRLAATNFIQSNPRSNALAGASALAVADLDGDGDLDLVVGGGAIPGRYPESRPTVVLRCRGDALEVDADNTRAVTGAGLVNGIVWSDLDGDGWPELILACEWGPIRIYANQAGRLRDATAEWGLAGLRGWWKGVATGDFDGDGRLDIVASNWGLNSPYHASTSAPLTMYYGDFSERGVNDLMECEHDATGVLLPRRSLNALATEMPFLREQFSTHQAFAATPASGVLGARRNKAREATVTTLASTLFLNRAGKLQGVPLPPEAQWAPAFGVIATDLNGDGIEDVVLSQNFFATTSETPRLDAGRGLWLRGTGQGTLIAEPATRSGLEIYGEQRGAAAADFNRDGRVDLVIAQNGSATRLLENVGARRGVRVRLKGPSGNPDGIGATVRARRVGGTWSPVREIQSGSGYWSMNSAVLVVAVAGEGPMEVSVRWPGGRDTKATVPGNVSEMVIDYTGQ